MASACSKYLLERLNEVLIMKCCRNSVSNRTPMKSFRLQKLNDNLVQKLNTALLSANAVAYDAEEKEYQNPTVKVLLNELKDAVYRADDLLDEIFTEDLQNSLDAESQTKKSQVCKPQSFHKRKGNRTKHIKRTMEETLHRLEDIVKNIGSIGLMERVYDMKLSPRMSTSLVKEDEVFGRHGDTKEIIGLLLSECGRRGLSVIRIVGMGGIGKTTLAQLVYNDYRVGEHFYLRAWVCISEYSDTFSATKAILESITSECCDLNNLDSLQVRLREVLMGRRFLLVLDDMWNDKYNDWDVLQAPFNDATPGSCVIITTRSHRVPAVKSTVYTHVYTHIMQPLSDEDSWNLFVTSAFGYEEPRPYKLEDIGREIACKCSGLPLAVKTIGNILGSKQILNEWQDCLQRLSFPSEEMHDVFSNIKLSYDALPAYLKRCFAYCSIFPKGYEFVKEKLVLLWMAEGLLQLPGENRRMEEVGDEYFRELVLRSFLFQTSENTSKYVMPDLWNNTSRFVMHDLLNDLAVSVAGEYCFTSKEFSHISARTRHLSVSNCNTSMTLEGVRNVKFLRSFLLLDHKSCHLSSNELQTLSKLQFLRVLSLSHHPIIKLPDSICNLIHLRYVDLSHSALYMLPESVCALCNLQTLILSNCQHLTELPKNTWKLINLRHLDINGTNLHEMPKKMSRLGNLGTLPYFVVNEESGSTVKELGGLLYLHGALRISKLQNVVSPDDAAEAGLANKRYLDELVLEWGDGTVDPHRASTMLEQLVPHTNLKRLSINFYSGISFPNWLGDFSFSNMVFLHLRKCNNCLELPPLGQLPSLKVLIIEGMTAVKTVGPEFYGRDMPLKSFESPKLKDIPFKSLETLMFDEMLEWREWTSFEGGEFPKFEGREFPCLQKLCIRRCPMLKGILPKQPRSLEIEIFECEFLSRHTSEVSPLPSTQGAIESSLLPPTEGATKSSLTMAEGTVDNSLPIDECITDSSLTMTQGTVANTLKETTKMEGRGQTEEKISLEIATTSESKWTKQEQKVFMEEDPSCSLYSDEKSSLPLTQGVIESSFPMAEGAVHTSLPMAEGVVDTSLPMTQDQNSTFPSTQGATESSLSVVEGAAESTLPMIQGNVSKTLKETLKAVGRGESEEETGLEKETTSETEGIKHEQKEFIEKDPSCSVLSDEKSSLLSTQGAAESSLPPLIHGAIDALLPKTQEDQSSSPTTQDPKGSLFTRSQTSNGRDEADVTQSSQDGVHYLSSFESMKVSEISELMELPRQVHSLKIEGCDDLKFIPEKVMDLKPPLKHLYIINCCSLESFPKDHPPIALKILYIRNCKKLDFPLTKEKTPEDALLEYLCIGSSCDSLKLISLDLFPMLKSLSIWDCENLKSLSMPEGILKKLAFLEALEIRDCPNLDTFPKGGLPTPNLTSIWLSNCNNLKQLPDQLQTLNSLQSMFLNNCPELESLSKNDFPSSLSLLSITFCNKLRLGTEWGLNKLPNLSRLEIEGISVNEESFPEENLLPSYLSSLRISGLLNLRDLNGKGLQHLTALKALEISCCDNLRSLPEDGFPSSLSFLCIKECSLLTSKFRNKRGKDWSKIAHIPCIEIDEEVIS